MNLSKKSILIFVFTVSISATALLSCEKAEELKLKKLSHENGLRISMPNNLQHKKTASGFVIYPKGGLDRRSPVRVRVDYLIGVLDSSQRQISKTIAGKKIYYRYSEATGGSGGTEFTLETYLIIGNSYIHTREVFQSEITPKPDFSLTWQVVKGME